MKIELLNVSGGARKAYQLQKEAVMSNGADQSEV